MASLIGTVANDGVTFRPRLVQAVMDRATGELQQRTAVPKRTLKLRPEILPLIKEALAGVVKEGTGTRAQSALVTIAGKTGTAQTMALRTGPAKDIPKKFRDHAWFVAFAPVEAPTIAVAVLAEHMGHGGSASAPLAKELIETYVTLDLPAPSGVTDGAVAREGDARGRDRDDRPGD
jgi:penicillin-binding protein 2